MSISGFSRRNRSRIGGIRIQLMIRIHFRSKNRSMLGFLFDASSGLVTLAWKFHWYSMSINNSTKVTLCVPVLNIGKHKVFLLKETFIWIFVLNSSDTYYCNNITCWVGIDDIVIFVSDLSPTCFVVNIVTNI